MASLTQGNSQDRQKVCLYHIEMHVNSYLLEDSISYCWTLLFVDLKLIRTAYIIYCFLYTRERRHNRHDMAHHNTK